jgi:hypothetical protein
MKKFEPLNGFELAGCAIRRWNIIAFWGQEWGNPDPLETRITRVFFYYPDEPEEERWAYREIGEARGLRGCGAMLPEERWVFVADDGEVYAVGGGVDAFEAPILSKPYHFFTNVKRIRPGKAYAVGPRRKVYVREASDTWRQLAAGLFPEGEKTNLDASGFSDIDGFADNDLYACGGRGDLWHFDGNAWSRIDVPTNENLFRVCCASDGLVYIITGARELLVGRGNSWALMGQDVTNAHFESIVEFGTRLILSTESELFEVANGAIQPANFGAPMPPMRSCSFLAAGDGIMVVAGSGDACSFDGTAWSVIVKS